MSLDSGSLKRDTLGCQFKLISRCPIMELDVSLSLSDMDGDEGFSVGLSSSDSEMTSLYSIDLSSSNSVEKEPISESLSFSESEVVDSFSAGSCCLSFCSRSQVESTTSFSFGVRG